MIAHDQNEASSSTIITALTTLSACMNRPKTDMSIGVLPPRGVLATWANASIIYTPSF